MKINIALKKVKRLFKDDSESAKTIHDYWKSPQDKANQPLAYISSKGKSEYLLKKMESFYNDYSILEIGCNIGRNLDHLYRSGFTNLSGIEISENALIEFKKKYKKTYDNVSLYNLSVENFFFRNYKDSPQFDVIFTMAVLEHLHNDSQWVFEKMAEQTRYYILTIEDEKSISWKHFPRNYKKVFEKHGMKQIEFEDLSNHSGFHKGFVYRLFEKIKE